MRESAVRVSDSIAAGDLLMDLSLHSAEGATRDGSNRRELETD